MQRINWAIVVVIVTAIIGCSSQLTDAPKGQEASRAKEEDRKPSSIPTFTYRPGSGLMIEGH
jgi:hypothetical protein